MRDLPILFSAPMVRALNEGRKTQTRRILTPQPTEPLSVEDGYQVWRKYRNGDRLWVRENFAILPRSCYNLPKTIAPDPDMAAYYRADFDRSGKPPWKPSIHMPRWVSRLTLTVTDVRIQRLQDISEADAAAEGVEPETSPLGRPGWFAAAGIKASSAKGAYRALWDEINGPGAWARNPWIVAVSFAVERRNIDAMPVETRRAAE